MRTVCPSAVPPDRIALEVDSDDRRLPPPVAFVLLALSSAALLPLALVLWLVA